MGRRAFAQRLVAAGFVGATGPTFSIYDNEPSSHHICMLLRHHRTVHDFQIGGLAVAPNLYWRDHRDRDRWVEWLDRESPVQTVSREFARTKDYQRFRYELSGLVDILQRLNRPLRVITVGVGIRKAHLAHEALTNIGCTLTLAAADPIMEAITNGRMLRISKNGKPYYARRRDTPRPVLATSNVRAAFEYVTRLAKGR